MEYSAIKEALLHFDDLALTGGILYVNDVPAAMTIASYINDDTVDIHFEKCIGEYAAAGGYAAINQMHAEALKKCNVYKQRGRYKHSGLRKAKESYHPKIMLKNTVQLKSNTVEYSSVYGYKCSVHKNGGL